MLGQQRKLRLMSACYDLTWSLFTVSLFISSLFACKKWEKLLYFFTFSFTQLVQFWGTPFYVSLYFYISQGLFYFYLTTSIWQAVGTSYCSNEHFTLKNIRSAYKIQIQLVNDWTSGCSSLTPSSCLRCYLRCRRWDFPPEMSSLSKTEAQEYIRWVDVTSSRVFVPGTPVTDTHTHTKQTSALDCELTVFCCYFFMSFGVCRLLLWRLCSVLLRAHLSITQTVSSSFLEMVFCSLCCVRVGYHANMHAIH